jgi:hypothetical protein
MLSAPPVVAPIVKQQLLSWMNVTISKECNTLLGPFIETYNVGTPAQRDTSTQEMQLSLGDAAARHECLDGADSCTYLDEWFMCTARNREVSATKPAASLT